MQFPASSQGDITRDTMLGLPFNSDHWNYHCQYPFSWEFLWLSSQSGLIELCQPYWQGYDCSQGTSIGGRKFRSTSQPNLACPGSLWLKSFCSSEPLSIGSWYKLLLWVIKIKVAKNGLFLTWISSLSGCSAQYVHEMGVGGERLVPAQCGYKQLGKKWEFLKPTTLLKASYRKITHPSLSSKTRTIMFLISWGRWMPQGNMLQVWRHSDPMVHPHYQVRMWNDFYQGLLQILAVLK